MLCARFEDQMNSGSEVEHFKVFSIYGCGGHFGYVI